MENNPIVFFDSGIGGLPYLIHLRDRLPNENYVYVADTKNFPYGEKSEKELKEIIINIITQIIASFKPKVIVVACNTASVTALNELRQTTTIPIVGVVPAIKTAASITKNNKIGILSTNRTAKGIYLKQLIEDFSANKEVYSVGASEIVSFVENELYKASEEKIQKFISKSVEFLKNKNVDSVVLGCTHFIHVEDALRNSFGNNVSIIDSREGVSNQIERVLSNRRLNSSYGVSQFYITSNIPNIDNYQVFCDDYGLNFEGELRK